MVDVCPEGLWVLENKTSVRGDHWHELAAEKKRSIDILTKTCYFRGLGGNPPGSSGMFDLKL